MASAVGVVLPQVYCRAHPGDGAWWLEADCPLRAGAGGRIRVTVRFVQLVRRTVARLSGEFSASWREAVERTVELDAIAPGGRLRAPIEFPSGRSLEPLPRRPDDESATVILREWEAIAGHVDVAAEGPPGDLPVIRVRIENHSPMDDPGAPVQDRAMLSTQVSISHSLLRLIYDGPFSLGEDFWRSSR